MMFFNMNTCTLAPPSTLREKEKNKAGYTAVRCVSRIICSLLLAPSLIIPSLFTPFPVPFHPFLSLPFTLRKT